MIFPMASAMMMRMPSCNGSAPMVAATDASTGTKINIAGAGSMNVPSSKNSTVANNRNTVGLLA